MYKKQSLKQSLILVLLIMFLCCLVLSPLLLKWVNDLEDVNIRYLAHALIDPLDQLSEKSCISKPFKDFRYRFRSFFLDDFTGPKESFNRYKSTDLPIGDLPIYIRDEIYSSVYPLKILLIGDSMMKGSVAALFRREASDYEYLEISELSKIASGLCRPDYFNWPVELKKVLETRAFDLVIAMFGMNDVQSIKHDNSYSVFGSDSWLNLYNSRLDNLVRLLFSRINKIYWIQLPPMRDHDYNEEMSIINRITENYFSSEPKARYIFTYDILSRNNQYSEFLEIQGKYTRVRNADGMHLSFDGAKVVARRLLEKIHDDFSFEIYLEGGKSEMISE